MKSQNQHDYASKLLKKCQWLPMSMVFHMSQSPLLISMAISQLIIKGNVPNMKSITINLLQP